MANVRPLKQDDTERAWLDLTYQVTRARGTVCICAPSGARWSGYLGAQFVDEERPRARVLFVGANHNPNGLNATPRILEYNDFLRAWAGSPRSRAGDNALLEAMRLAYEKSWPTWGAVWDIFGDALIYSARVQ